MDFNQICKAIREVKIQGAENIAIASLKAYSLKPTESSIKILTGLRPTEPTIVNALKFAKLYSVEAALEHFNHSKEKILGYSEKIIKKNCTIYTHCHSSTVNEIIKHNKNKKIKVNCTETRPLFQGRKTAAEISKAKIPITLYVDSAMRLALKNANITLLGADSILKDGKVINKIGSELVAETSSLYKIPLYICTDSWKFDPKSLQGKEIKIEYRSTKEIWENPPKGLKILNPAFEKINPKLITGIISELGVLTPEEFTDKVIKNYRWML